MDLRGIILLLFSTFVCATPMLVVPQDGLWDAVNTTNVSIRHKVNCHREWLLVTVTRKQEIQDNNHNRIAQAATNLVYHFDLNPTRNYKEGTVQGVPLKLYPVKQGRMSTFATFLPSDAEGYFDNSHKSTDDDDEQHKEPLLWSGTQQDFDAKVVVEIDISPEDGSRTATVRTWTDQELEPVVTAIPHKERHNITIKEVILHYYRGNSGKAYGRLQEAYEYLHTAVVGFLSPIMIFGIVLTIIVIGVFVCCDLFVRNAGTATTVARYDQLDEKMIV